MLPFSLLSSPVFTAATKSVFSPPASPSSFSRGQKREGGREEGPHKAATMRRKKKGGKEGQNYIKGKDFTGAQKNGFFKKVLKYLFWISFVHACLQA